VTPEVICADSRGALFFGYTNSSDLPARIDGTNNALTGSTEDLALAPTLFGLGHVTPAFWAYGDDAGNDPTWTLIGPDGTSRTAARTDATPDCPDTQPKADGDARTPDLLFAYALPRDLVGDPTSVHLTAEMVGADGPSACPGGLTAQPGKLFVQREDEPAIAGTRLELDLPFTPFTDPVSKHTYLLAETGIEGIVVDTCTAGDASTKSWPLGEDFERLREGVMVCIRYDDFRTTMEVVDQPYNCAGLPLTDGVRIRSLPPGA
jgi:hypothetical protein